MHAMLADYEAGGIVAELLTDWPNSIQRDAVGLRLAAALHFAVLTGRDAALAAAYPAADPDWTMGKIWPVAARYMQGDQAFVYAFIQSAPQTNEVNRSLILAPGFLDLAARYNQPLHMLELGASAGLNQNWDHYAYDAGAWQRPGNSDVVLKTEWNAPIPKNLDATVQIASRAACDLNPIDVMDDDQALRLQSYVWPDQPHRLRRLQAAIALARQTGLNLEKADAADWLEKRLCNRPKTGLTVVYHSVFLHYPPMAVQARIRDAIQKTGAAATKDSPFAWLCFEAEAYFGGLKASGKMVSRLQTWPGGDVQTYGSSDGHIMTVEKA